MKASCPIGIFDSSIGGLSTLPALRAALPHEHLLYWADSAHAPYGEKGDDFVRLRSLAITHPEADRLQAAYAAIGLSGIGITAGPANICATLRTPKGEVTLQSLGL